MNVLRVAAYPATLLIAFGVFAGLNMTSMPLTLSTYAAVFTGIGLIVLLERKIPYRRAWRPARREWLNDASYALLVQVLLPRLLGIATALWLAGRVNVAGFWPGAESRSSRMIATSFATICGGGTGELVPTDPADRPDRDDGAARGAVFGGP